MLVYVGGADKSEVCFVPRRAQERDRAGVHLCFKATNGALHLWDHARPLAQTFLGLL
jgi:hypothetical protein